jgi:hypothetical protein
VDKDTKRIVIVISSDVHSQFKSKCSSIGLKIQEVGRKLIYDYLKRSEAGQR